MNNPEHIKFEYAQANWRQSIAVQIAAQIIWVIIPIVFVSSVFLFHIIEQDTRENFTHKVDALSYRISNAILNNKELSDDEKTRIIKSIASDLDFPAVSVITPDYQLLPDIDVSKLTASKRTVQANSDDKLDNPVIVITSYNTSIDKIIDQKRKNILAVILICLVVFATFLVFSIRQKLYKPLKMLVDATVSAADENYNVTLDTDRGDEFGHLSIFFRRMLNRLSEQHNKLKEAAEDAKQANTAKSAFLANMSHELRTPLNAIIGYSEMMMDETRERNDSVYAEDLIKIIAAGKHLLHLINEVLDLSKIEAGKLELNVSEIDIPKLVYELQNTIEPLARKNNNTIYIELDKDLKYFYSDEIKLRQILINLFANACKFTENGNISLKVATQKTKTEKNVVFVVSDTGVGIRAEYLDKLFEPFTQGDNSSTRNYSGTGLGLSICRHLCLFLGGEITVNSTAGEGTVFVVTLPFEIKAPDPGSSKQPKAAKVKLPVYQSL